MPASWFSAPEKIQDGKIILQLCIRAAFKILEAFVEHPAERARESIPCICFPGAC
jgi:hypothetical protein